MFSCLEDPQILETKSGTPGEKTVQVNVQQSEVERPAYPTKLFAGHYCVPNITKVTGNRTVSDSLKKSGPLGTSGQQFLLMIAGLRRAGLALACSAALAVAL